MKNSIAREVTRRVSLLLVCALALLFIGSFFIVYHVVYLKNQKYSQAIVSMYSDLLVNNPQSGNLLTNTEKTVFYGDYFCTWYGVDNAFVYRANVKDKSITYVSMSGKDGNKKNDNYIGHTEPHELNVDELAVLNGKETFAKTNRKSSKGRYVRTVICVKDAEGNKYMVGVDVGNAEIYKQIAVFFSNMALIIAAVLLGIYFSVYYVIKKKVSKPAQTICKGMQDFITDGKRHSEKLLLDGSDEYTMIADAFNSMTDDIDSYVENIASLTRKQEHQNTELEIAARIQRGFLPKECFESGTYRINTKMIPAKNVGGDLYDYFNLDENRVFTVVADVSGKGLSAALFMAVTLMQIRQFAKLNLPPSKVLEKANEMLSENNAALLFATAFVGVYDKRDRTFTYANAGHNTPYVIGDKLTPLTCEAGTPLGLFEGEKYSQNTVELKRNDTLFLYTDGVTESTDKDLHFYGTKRLEDALASFSPEKDKDAVAYITEKIGQFASGAEQHDDITILSLYVKPKTELDLKLETAEFVKIKDTLLSLPVKRQDKLTLCLAAEECFVNICSYAFPNGAPDTETVKFSVDVSDEIVMRFEDGGEQFDPTKDVKSDSEYDIDSKIGGLGRMIAFADMDEVTYKYENGKNILTLIKKVQEEKK